MGAMSVEIRPGRFGATLWGGEVHFAGRKGAQQTAAKIRGKRLLHTETGIRNSNDLTSAKVAGPLPDPFDAHHFPSFGIGEVRLQITLDPTDRGVLDQPGQRGGGRGHAEEQPPIIARRAGDGRALCAQIIGQFGRCGVGKTDHQ